MKKSYNTPTIATFSVVSVMMSSSCICHGTCTCSHNENYGSGGHGNQPMCTCGNRPTYNSANFYDDEE